jgi:glycerol kinase
MSKDCGSKIQDLKVDGGASKNNYLMQFQSDLLGCRIHRPEVVETTAMGAAYLAGLAVGYWKDMDQIINDRKEDVFTPAITQEEADQKYDIWTKAVAAARLFTK